MNDAFMLMIQSLTYIIFSFSKFSKALSEISLSWFPSRNLKHP